MANGINTEAFLQIDEIKAQAINVVTQLLSVAKLRCGDIVIVGCSSSEIASKKIGTYSSEEIGKAVFEAIHGVLKENGLYLAAQCCEHLNRAVILEREATEKRLLPIVNVVPQLKAGGSFATAAYKGLNDPVAVEGVLCNAGIDIGDTLIGMHLMPVAVPVRTQTNKIGAAHVVCARTRPKFIGGVRAGYDETLG